MGCQNLISLAMLNNLLDEYQHPLIARCETTAKVWAKLYKVYESHDISMQMHLRDALHAFKKKTCDFMSRHITKVYLYFLIGWLLYGRLFRRPKRTLDP